MAINLTRPLRAQRFTTHFTLDDASDQVRLKPEAVVDAVDAASAAFRASIADNLLAAASGNTVATSTEIQSATPPSKFVQADKLATALTAGVAFSIRSYRATGGNAVVGRSMDGSGNGVVGFVDASTTTGNSGVFGSFEGAGTGSAVGGVTSGAGTGHGGYFEKKGAGTFGHGVAGVNNGASGGSGVYGSVTASASNVASTSGVWGEVYNGTDGAGVTGWYKGTGPGSGVAAVNDGSGGGPGLFVLTLGTKAGIGVQIDRQNTGGGDALISVFGGAAGTAAGHAVSADYRAAGPGHAGYFVTGALASASGTAAAVAMLNGTNGTRNAVLDVNAQGANTTWTISTNGTIYSPGGVNTSDERIKRDIKVIEGDALEAAVTLSKDTELHTFLKLKPRSVVRDAVAGRAARAQAELDALVAPAVTGDEDYDAVVAQVYANKVAELTELAAEVADESDEALTLGYQVGVIAQKLQAQLQALGHFEFLVKTAERGLLVVDTDSLQFVIQAGLNERLRRAGF